METSDIINVEDLIEVGYRFSELGTAIAEASANNDRLFDDALDNLKTLQDITDSLSADTFEQIKTKMGVNITYAPELINTYKNSIMSADKIFESLNSSVTQFKDSLGKPTDRQLTPYAKPADPKKATDTEEKKKKSSLLRKEFEGASSMLKTFASAMKLPLAGGLIAGGMLWMAMGFKRKQRIEAEAGEIKNILVSATDATVKGVLDKATSHLSGLQERLQKQYGVIRGDFQGVVKAFVDGGVEIGRTLEKVGSGLGEASKNTLLLTYSVDKMLELPGGTTAKRAVQTMAEYGYSFEKATNSVVDLSLAAQESGIGAAQFMKNIAGVGDELKEFGFGIDAVADLTLTLQDRFEDLGVPKQFAGRQAAIGMKQMASGLVNMSMDWQMYIAEKAGYGEGLGGRQKMVSAMGRVGREGSETELMEMYRVLGSVAMDISGGDETIARQVLEQSMGLGFEGARSAVEIMKAINTGDVVSAKKIAQERQKELRDALTTEKGKRNRWELQVNNWMDAISMIGEGLLANAAKILAYLLVLGKSGMALAVNFMMGRKEENQQILNNIDAFMKKYPLSSDKLEKGWDKASEILKEMGLNVAGDAAKAVTAAWDMDVTDPNWKGKGGATTPPASPFAGAGAVATPMVQTITVPVSEPGTYTPKYSARTAEGRKVNEIAQPGLGWVGGAISIVSKGADSVGNIKLSLVGNCPQCGLSFGGGGRVPDAGKSVEVFNPNTQKSALVDPTSSAGMEDLSKLSVSGKARRAVKRGKAETEKLDPRLGKIIKQISEEFPGKRIKMFRGATEKGGVGEHAKGTAMDIGVEGVKPKDLFDFVSKNVKGGGKGYYPNQPFIHVDVRPGTANWVDFSKKGEKGGKHIGGAAATSWFKSNKNEEEVELAGRGTSPLPTSST